MRSLVQDAEADPDALDGLRKAGVDYMVRSFSNADGSLSGARFIRLVADNRDTLAELYEPKQVSMFGAVARDAEVGARWRTETAIKGGADTVKNLGAMAEQAHQAGKHFSFMSAAIGAASAAFAHGGAKEAAYAGGAAGIAYLYNALRSTGLNAARERYRKALLDPQLAAWRSNEHRPCARVSRPKQAMCSSSTTRNGAAGRQGRVRARWPPRRRSAPPRYVPSATC